jgi:hypothetical protein
VVPNYFAPSRNLSIRIDNPTDDRISLLSDGSYVIGPDGQSHPLQGRVIGAHNFARFPFRRGPLLLLIRT